MHQDHRHGTAAAPARGGPPPSGAADLVAPPRPGDLRLFHTGAFGLTWGIAALLLLAGPQVEALLGTFDTHHPLYYLAVYAPTLTAVALTARREGRPGLHRLARRTLRWRVGLRYHALVLLGWPAMDYAARLLQHLVTGEAVVLAPFVTLPTSAQPGTWYLVPALLASTLLIDAGPLGEETGQRGYVLPRMLAVHRSPLVAALVLGLLWGVWHVPAFLIGGTAQHDTAMGVGWLVLGTTAASVLMTWLHLRVRGSVLVAGILPHLMINVSVSDVWALSVVMTLVAVPTAVSLHRTSLERALRR